MCLFWAEFSWSQSESFPEYSSFLPHEKLTQVRGIIGSASDQLIHVSSIMRFLQ